MPNSVLEAMAFGLPIVTRPVGGIVDLFGKGRIGFMTQSEKPEDFALLLEKFILNPELGLEIGKENYLLAVKNFSASTVAKRLRRIYANVLRGEECPQEWGSPS